MSRQPLLPPAPLLPSDSSRWLEIGWRTWRGALALYFKSPLRPIRPDERTPLLSMMGLLHGLEVRPAEWVVHRLTVFGMVREKIGLDRPPFRFVWSEKALMDQMDRGMGFVGELSLPITQPIRGMSHEDVLKLEQAWKDRAASGEFLWSGALLLGESDHGGKAGGV